MVRARFTCFHSIVAGAPHISSDVTTDAHLAARMFSGTGAPSVSTLPAGNGKYCGLSGGWVVAATIYAEGTGYAVNDVLTLATGTGTALQLTVDKVGTTGNIIDFHVSTAGNYTVYPDATAATTTTGAGTGAVFLPAIQPADQYIDKTDPTNPVLYVCKTPGTNSTSAWSKISGGTGGTGGFVDDYDNTQSYQGGSIVRVLSAMSIGGVTLTPGVYGLVSSLSVPALGTGNQVPQYPEPTSGTVYWKLLSLPVQVTNVCSGSGSVTVYVNASAPLA